MFQLQARTADLAFGIITVLTGIVGTVSFPLRIPQPRLERNNQNLHSQKETPVPASSKVGPQQSSSNSFGSLL